MVVIILLLLVISCMRVYPNISGLEQELQIVQLSALGVVVLLFCESV